MRREDNNCGATRVLGWGWANIRKMLSEVRTLRNMSLLMTPLTFAKEWTRRALGTVVGGGGRVSKEEVELWAMSCAMICFGDVK